MTADTRAAGGPARSIEYRIVEFVHHLRGLGLPIGVDQAVSFGDSFKWIQPFNRDEVYYAARATLLNRSEYRKVFDQAFAEFWEAAKPSDKGQKAPLAPRHRRNEFHRSSLVSFMAEKAKRESKEIDVLDRTETATDVEWLQRKDFSRLTDAELRSLREMMDGLRWEFSRRKSHRLTKSHRGGVINYRETLRRAAKLGGTIVELPRRARKEKPRPLVLLADISGSMELYSRIVLQFFHVVSQQLDNTEVFVFGTRLTRVTDAFRLRDTDVALDAVSNEVIDFAGGTRIAESLCTFRREWATRVLRRGAVVLVISDGCETGDNAVHLRESDINAVHLRESDNIDALRLEVQSLQRACYRLIWLNPRLGQHRYEPRVQGMAAVLPFVDDFLPIHNFESLRQLRNHLADLPRRKGTTSEVSRRL